MASELPVGLSPESWLVAAGRPTGEGEPLNTPPVLATNFDGSSTYARSEGTATWRAFEEIIGGLESGDAVSFSSGMAAVSAVFSLLPAGSHVTIPEDCYHGVSALAERGSARGHWTLGRLSTTDTAGWIAALDRPGLVWLESPSNPLLEVAELSIICGEHRGPGTLVAVDNTFSTPLGAAPLALGADLSVHAATKSIGGHSDLLMGVAVASTPHLAARLAETRTVEGATPGALEAFLAIRGSRTLAVRRERAQRNAGILAERLEHHDAVERVRYPGLASHPGHETARREMRGFGSVISFELRGGAAVADTVCEQTRLIRHATSLGGVDSTMERRAAITGQEHLPPGLIRLSVGIEDPDDLWSDLSRALRPVSNTQ